MKDSYNYLLVVGNYYSILFEPIKVFDMKGNYLIQQFVSGNPKVYKSTNFLTKILIILL